MAQTITTEILTIGDELLIGQVVDTNSAYMANLLNENGVAVKQITSVHDDADHIRAAIAEAFTRTDIVLTTGGLGPTRDDITKAVLCDYFSTQLVESEIVKQHILTLYAERPDVLNRLTETQWKVPQSADILTNRVGSAPIMVFRKSIDTNHMQWLIAMPGVPYEMQIAMEEQVIPYINTHILPHEARQITHLTALVSGIAESALALHLEEWETALPDTIHLAYLPKDGTIRLRLSAYNIPKETVQKEFDTMCRLVHPWLVLREDIPVEQALGNLLTQRGQTISTAESCTGGRLAALLNAHSGSSAYYTGSVIAYDNRIKESVLGVRRNDLTNHGAVSEVVVRQMADGIRALMHTDYAIATSGIAGPTGGTKEKPVGTVWIAWATPKETFTECFHLGKLREQITLRACNRAIIRLLQHLTVQ